jgi:hypothetical protein
MDKKWEYNETVHQLFVDYKKAYDSVRRKVLYNILIEFGVPMQLARLIKMCLNETYIKVRIGKYLCDTFSIQNGLKQGDALTPLLFNFSLEQWYSTWGTRIPGGTRGHLKGYVKLKKNIYIIS